MPAEPRAERKPRDTHGATTGDDAMDDLTVADVHDLPETASTDRRHRLERVCWCDPEVIEQDAHQDLSDHSTGGKGVESMKTPVTQESLLKAMGDDAQKLGGYLRCRSCGEHKQLGAVNMRLKNGWPKCCGQTMEWITQRQIREGYLDDPEAWLAKERLQRRG